MKLTLSSHKLAAAAVLLVSVTAAFADKADPVFQDGSGVAIRGYDPVAYFTDQKPVKGSEQFTFAWMGATWRFATAAHRDQFAANPSQYAPQYGGYCSYAVSKGHTASIDPEAWRIVDGKLYLNYSKSVQQKWAQDVPGNIQKANQNWPALHK
ncbi:MAG TPA: YHS domain-containing (seleno)protein [Terriglobia bacterium]|nr:YHS domain-containing (seleno)protein [Terriglobia bacterium]